MMGIEGIWVNLRVRRNVKKESKINLMMTKLDDLGSRICIIGPSSSGKSTLATFLGGNLNINVCHLDQIAHIPNTNWEPRNKFLFANDHNFFLENNQKWIIDGNFSFLMKDRFSQATSIIWLDFNVWGSLSRYIKRTIKNSDSRLGNLEGAKHQFSIGLVNYIIFKAPKNRIKYKKLIEESKTKLIYIDSFKKLKEYYALWNITLNLK